MSSSRLPRGRHDLTPEQVRDAQRSRLLNAMAGCVAEKGLAATTVADVIARAGVSRRTFYELFKDKDDCFLAAYRLGVSVLMDAIREAQAEPGSWEERVERSFVALTDVMAANPDFTKLCILEIWTADGEARALHYETIQGFRIFLADLEDQLGEIVFGGLVGGISSILFREIEAGRTEEIRRIVPALVDFVMLPLAGLTVRRPPRRDP